MTAQRFIPAIVLQSLPQCCVICDGERWVIYRPIRGDDGGSSFAYPTSAPVPCPHCTSSDALLSLIEVAQ